MRNKIISIFLVITLIIPFAPQKNEVQANPLVLAPEFVSAIISSFLGASTVGVGGYMLHNYKINPEEQAVLASIVIASFNKMSQARKEEVLEIQNAWELKKNNYVDGMTKAFDPIADGLSSQWENFKKLFDWGGLFNGVNNIVVTNNNYLDTLNITDNQMLINKFNLENDLNLTESEIYIYPQVFNNKKMFFVKGDTSGSNQNVNQYDVSVALKFLRSNLYNTNERRFYPDYAQRKYLKNIGVESGAFIEVHFYNMLTDSFYSSYPRFNNLPLKFLFNPSENVNINQVGCMSDYIRSNTDYGYLLGHLFLGNPSWANTASVDNPYIINYENDIVNTIQDTTDGTLTIPNTLPLVIGNDIAVNTDVVDGITSTDIIDYTGGNVVDPPAIDDPIPSVEGTLGNTNANTFIGFLSGLITALKTSLVTSLDNITTGIDAVIDTVVTTTTTAIDAAITTTTTGIDAVIDTVSTTTTNIIDNIKDITQPQEIEELDIDKLKNIPSIIFTKFPFCIPFDFINLISSLGADPVAPQINYNLDLNNIGAGQLDFNFNFNQFDGYAVFIRNLNYIIFVIFLMFSTRALIWK